MSTRSLIVLSHYRGKAVDMRKGVYETIYCHSDGYPEYNGCILRDSYTKRTKVKQLMALGDLSALGHFIGHYRPFEIGNIDGMCWAYGRDRGEKCCESHRLAGFEKALNQAANCDAEYVYTYHRGQWACWDMKRGEAVDLNAVEKHPLA